MIRRLVAPFILLCSTLSHSAHADRIGAVDTSWKFLGPDNKIIVESFDDPDIHGITCYLSRAKTGGLSGAVGVAEDKTEASLACLATGHISIASPLPHQQDIAKIKTSLLFKTLHLVRIIDPARQTAVYLTYSDKVIDGSPKNSLSVVPLGTPVTIRP